MKRTARIMALLLCVAGVLSGVPAVAKMSIVNSKHNLSISGPGWIKSLTETRICIFCHTPHNAAPKTPLWNKKIEAVNYTLYSSTTLVASPQTPTGPSKLCLSCHDGTIALGDVLQPSSGIAMTVGGGMPLTSPSYFGTSLASHHPISFSYYDALANQQKDWELVPTPPADLPFSGNKIIECTTCHDPHDDTNRKFLRVDSSDSALCIKCHSLTGWGESSHNTSQSTWNLTGTAPWPRTGGGTDFGWMTVQQNGCENCHNPHNAGGPARLLNYQQEENNCYPCHNGNVATTNIQADFSKTYRHDVAATEIGVTTYWHEPNESPLMLMGSSPHVECVDCHNPHAVNNKASTGAPAVSGKLFNVSGVDITNTPLVPPNNYAANEYEICFKCHADPVWRFPSYYTPVARWVSTIDMRVAFQTSNSAHFVEGPGVVTPDVPSLYTVNDPTLTSTKVLFCTDCHDSDSSRSIGGSGPRGPHGSIWKPLVRQEYETLDIGTPYQTQFYALCYWCHSEASILNDVSFKKNGQSNLGGHSGHLTSVGATPVNAPCSVCHDPHGVPGDVLNSGDHTHLINFDRNSVSPAAGNAYPIFTDGGSPGIHSGSCTLVCHNVVHDGSAKFSYGGSIQIHW